METFRQKLASIIGADNVERVCQLIDTDIIGEYESLPIPNFTSPADIERFQELDNDTAVKNALRREQREKLVQK